MVPLGRVSGIFGVRGWLRVHSDTEPRDNILSYSPWYLERSAGWEPRRLLDGRRQGKGLVARLQGCDDRDQAAELMGCLIAVPRDRLPALGQDEYYWSDLEGLRVVTADGVDLGQVSHLFATGANDVLVVDGERERLLPYVWDQVILQVDLEAGLIRVDWDPKF
jgi:16S rRNA processing protein RimM